MFESFKPFRRGQVASWEYLRLGEGQSWRGFMAGPMVGVPTHFEGGTIACRKAISKGALKCTCDVKEMETRWRGYAPLWDKDGVRWVVIIGERFGELGMRVKTLDQVRVTKTTGRGFPLKLEAHVWTTTEPELTKAERMPQDLRRWMARIWDDEELEQWIYDHRDLDADLSKPVPFTKPDTTTPHVVEVLKSRITLKPNAKDAAIPDTLEKLLGKNHRKNGKPN